MQTGLYEIQRRIDGVETRLLGAVASRTVAPTLPEGCSTMDEQIAAYSNSASTHSSTNAWSQEHQTQLMRIVDTEIVVRHRNGRTSFKLSATNDEPYDAASDELKLAMVRQLQGLRLLVWLLQKQHWLGRSGALQSTAFTSTSSILRHLKLNEQQHTGVHTIWLECDMDGMLKSVRLLPIHTALRRIHTDAPAFVQFPFDDKSMTLYPDHSEQTSSVGLSMNIGDLIIPLNVLLIRKTRGPNKMRIPRTMDPLAMFVGVAPYSPEEFTRTIDSPL